MGSALIFLADLFFRLDGGLTFSSLISFDRGLILQGQVWRVITFIFAPFSSNPLWMLISCSFYWFIGTRLESEWGGFNFNVYYFTGVIGLIIAGFIGGYAHTLHLNLSLFLAFATLYPNVEFMIFFILPVKAKYLAWIDAAFLTWEFIQGVIALAVTHYPAPLLIIIFSMLSYALFFGGDFIGRLRHKFKFRKLRSYFKSGK